MDEIIRYLRRMDERERVTSEDYEKVGNLISEKHLEAHEELNAAEFAEMVEATDRVENAILAAVYDDAELDVGQCILVLRGHKQPDEAELPEPSMEAFNEAMSGVDDGFERLLVNLADSYEPE